MRDDDLAVGISEMLASYSEALGEDRAGYTNHVIRVLLFCDELAELAGTDGERPSRDRAYRAAGVFHDLGIWTDKTFDYLVPSVELAEENLEHDGMGELARQVRQMIELHHKQRAAGPPDDPVEIFRRADLVDLSLGLRRFGIPLARVREIRRAYPNRGFHRRLIALGTRRAIEHPTSPLPMFKW